MEKYIFLLMLFSLLQYYSAASSNETDQEALLAFKKLVASPTSFLAKNWAKNTSFCSWFGVTCSSKRQRVVALMLPNLLLQGTISPSLANLSFLRVLDLGNNFLHGSIPYGLGHLPRLRVIDIQNNQLQGNIPPSLFQHQRVQVILLAFNKLGGEMWQGPWYVPELRVLDLTNNMLTNIIPPSVGNATKLVNFSLLWNMINGSIPKEIGNLSHLSMLVLSHNQLTGFIPAGLFNISSLLVIRLGNNSLSGPLTLSEGSILSNLKSLIITQNQISGGIPSYICQFKQLKILSTAVNNMTGEIPKNIDCLAKLEEFYISHNAINGTIPSSLGNISSLRQLVFASNRIEGHIPPELEKLSKLRILGLDENRLVGEIPKPIFNISSLEIIGITDNNLSGTLPTTAGLHLPNLKGVYVGGNQLHGEIPLHIANASMLSYLDLGRNFFTGTIPTNFGNLRKLKYLFLNSNELINEPGEHDLKFLNSLVNCRMLKVLSVGHNPLGGVLPNSIGNLSSSTETLDLEFAYIHGHIPMGIGNMSGLILLSISGNNLMGSIPPEFGRLQHLQGLLAPQNKLQAHIPNTLCQLSNLVMLWLHENELSGPIPECIGNISTLQQFELASNKLSSKIPLSLWNMSGIFNLNLSQNLLHGQVPLVVGELKAIVQMDISNNHFSGKIPSTLGDLQNLVYISLSNNSFSGSIPSSFSKFIGLEFMDLSLNALSGTIPTSLEKLRYLKVINVSFNDLEGEIPSGGVFANSTRQSFLGNKGLCGMHILEVPNCALITNPAHQSKFKSLMLKVVMPVVITSSFLVCLLVLIRIIKQRNKGKSKDVEKVSENRTYQLVSYHELRRATNNFDGLNLIGVGSSGSVYKGILSSGTKVAIKVLDLQNEQACKRFDTECEVLRNVRHRNLVTVISTCCSDYIRAFVLQYMPNGSLENWLYKEERHLNLLQRVTVMLDVAVAIEYLHHGYDTPIVHCDLKPANILLDEDMVAHVGDFGISKILAVSKFVAHTETLGTLGYIAPEYGLEGIVSSRSDVYSYGITLMEVFTKRRPTDREMFDENLSLRQWIRRAFPRTMMEVVDVGLFHEEEHITSESEICIASMIELALECTEENPESRKTMRDVVNRINKIKKTYFGM